MPGGAVFSDQFLFSRRSRRRSASARRGVSSS
eukprot:CAMPEP_0179370312 /NCGR_PEP_ID=MMETSP0797-20121207/85108_1 /TAXON_ID=47934 /ORGANISM="Dinophysis acuminata, Strain DAEP01" /LENGTH=31 /DNA_ID= /DNA_START= /DNA_END= /DNA_ORIENTATION=